MFDRLEEKRLGRASFGSTQSGIAPFYSDKYLKIGFQVSELYEEGLKDKINNVCMIKTLYAKAVYGEENVIDPGAMYDYLTGYKERLKPYVGDTFRLLREIYRRGGNILLEGQLGALRDLITAYIRS
jgi:adenylosuccinate synthase